MSTLSGDIEALSKRLDPDDRGRVDREAFVLWLTSGFDLRQASGFPLWDQAVVFTLQWYHARRYYGGDGFETAEIKYTPEWKDTVHT